MKYKDKTLKFASNLAPLILNENKTLTYRVGDKYDFLQKGDTIKLEDSGSGNIFAEVEIVNRSYTTFGELPLTTVGHEAYSSQKERREKFKTYYGREIDDDEKILVIQFRIL